MKTLMRSAGLALLAIAVCAPSASAVTLKCQRAIAKESSKFVQARVKALSKCEGAVVKNGTGSCPDDKTTSSITKAEGKLAAAIGKACGGDDKVCGGDLTGEDSPASVGWPSVCPNFEKGLCTNAINDCGGIATCLTCIGSAASDQAMSLYYDDLDLPSADQLNKCQIAIGKAASAFLNSASKILQKCEDARMNNKHSNNCFEPSVGDGKYQAALAKAEAKKVNTICKACGGPDKLCDGNADISPPTIGFATTCPGVTRPNGGMACVGDGSIDTLNELLLCVDCVTAFKADCLDLLTVPQFGPYPIECSMCVEPPLTGACPTTLSFTADGPNVNLDTGFTGLAHDASVPTNGRISLNVSNCDSVNHPGCGECDVSGPIDNAGGDVFDNHRCQDASWVKCSVDADCTGAMQCVGGSNNGALCTNGSECPGGACNNAGHAGPCIYFFGSPLPLRAGGVSTCVVNEINGPISGTINVDDGTSTTSVPLSSKVHPIGTEFAPCPRCTGGTCQDGPRFGQACTVQGTSNFFGDVSLDCPPNPGSLAGTLGINLEIATGTQQKTLATTNPNCRQTGFTGLECFCDTCNNVVQESCSSNAECPMSMGEPGICGGKRCIGGPDGGEPCGSCIGGTNAGANCTNSTACPGGSCANPRVCVMGANDGAGCSNNSQCPGGTCAPECAGGGLCNRPGEATQPNSCLDDTNTLGLDGCTDTGNDEGECVVGPSDPVCETQFFRACNTNADCQPSVTCPECIPGQACVLRQRSCFTDNGIVGNSITVQGSPDVPCGNVSRPEVGTFFCVAPVGATAVNAAGGLPGVGRVRIPGTVVIDP